MQKTETSAQERTNKLLTIIACLLGAILLFNIMTYNKIASVHMGVRAEIMGLSDIYDRIGRMRVY